MIFLTVFIATLIKCLFFIMCLWFVWTLLQDEYFVKEPFAEGLEVPEGVLHRKIMPVPEDQPYPDVVYDGITLCCPKDVLQKVALALNVLRAKAPKNYEFFKMMITRIQFTQEPKVHSHPELQRMDINANVRSLSVKFLVSLFFHEALHCSKYHLGKDYSGNYVEKEIVGRQIEFLKFLKASSRDVAWLKRYHARAFTWDLRSLMTGDIEHVTDFLNRIRPERLINATGLNRAFSKFLINRGGEP